MNSSPLLSIYIPVHNHSKIIENNLEVMAQEIRQIGAVNDIEVVISDNASSDDTQDKVRNFIKNNSDLNILYDRNEVNIGGIKNILHLWDKTTGLNVIMIGDDCFAKNGLVSVYGSLKENSDADIIILKNNAYTDFEYIKDASVADVIRNFEKLQYIGNFVLKRSHFAIKFNDYKIDYINAYPHLILIMDKIMDAKRVVDTRFVAINIAISWNFYKTIKIILKLPIDCIKIAEMSRGKIGEKNYKMLLKSLNKSLYNSVRFVRGHKNRLSLLKYVWQESPVKNPKVLISLALHCLPAPLFYLFKFIDSGFKYSKYCFQEMRQNRVRWKEKDFVDFQDHTEDKFTIL
jgi:hypothetical protein